ncbi:MAG: tRNA preQ1(34) S-adenosylmethionine ribosyltransferase-isomerase QueA [Hyphomicrobiaceae bacterium]|nr:tRNA preQ1(34) S-adenosylmethionine ribosyltransferase-isomerase QueA [Hyphomicrobiaceae bacterium]
MRVDEFDFVLPEDRIALRPVHPRDAARMLCVNPRAADPLQDRGVRDLPGILNPGDALVFNDTRVIPAQLSGIRYRDDATANVSVTLIEPVDASRWKALARPAKRLRAGDRISFGNIENVCLQGTLWAHVESRQEGGGEVTLAFDFHGSTLDEAIAALGEMPLPPYIASRRAPDAGDVDDYQTVYARERGAVAAPTAGLHFTKALLKALRNRGIEEHFVTLHVGAGTFLPVKVDDTRDHHMHAERCEIDQQTADALNDVRGRGGRIIAVGSTSLRVLESAAGDTGRFVPFNGETDIFITPGYRFKAVDAMITNFHLPRSTLFMLVSAFCGLEIMKQAYAHAIANGYRFYSYGDACFLQPS